jgi:5-methylcytosine-specific restriction protein A
MSRQEFSAKTKTLAFKRCGGHCECCTRKLFPGDYHYDHDNPDGLTGDASLDNCRVLCRACHQAKTRKDVAAIAKAKRLERRQVGIRKPRTITRWRRFDRSIVEAPRER